MTALDLDRITRDLDTKGYTLPIAGTMRALIARIRELEGEK